MGLLCLQLTQPLSKNAFSSFPPSPRVKCLQFCQPVNKALMRNSESHKYFSGRGNEADRGRKTTSRERSQNTSRKKLITWAQGGRQGGTRRDFCTLHTISQWNSLPQDIVMESVASALTS